MFKCTSSAPEKPEKYSKTPFRHRISAYTCILYTYLAPESIYTLRTVHFVTLINLTCVDIAKCQVKFCLLVKFFIDFKHFASSGACHLKSVG